MGTKNNPGNFDCYANAAPDEPPPKPRPLKLGVRWAEDGMYVWIFWDRDKGTAKRCKVACAVGYLARVVNEEFNVDKWVHLDNLLVPEGDIHGYCIDET